MKIEQQMTEDPPASWLDTQWKTGVVFCWLVICVALVLLKWPDIQPLSLSDTDDNLRLAQVRAWLDGQSWFDLRQYRLAAPAGADIHWSRLPDLPIAALIVLLRPMAGAAAENWAVTIAPLIPLGIAMVALALTVRRLIAPKAWPLTFVVLILAVPAMRMWMPLRIDHHGWQLAMLAIAIAGFVDNKAKRGAATTGIATALSFAIGLEILAFLALLGALTAFSWVRDRGEAHRIAVYGVTLSGGTAIGFAIFASHANRAAVCDALSPVWLSVLCCAGGLLVLISFLKIEKAAARMAVMLCAGAVLAAGFALFWPHCVDKPEGISPLLQTLWLDNVREARPLMVQSWQPILLLLTLPLTGIAGYILIATKGRTKAERDVSAGCVAIALASVGLLFWQVRFAPAAQVIAVPGAVALGWHLLPRVRAYDNMLRRLTGTIGVLLLMTGIWAVVPVAMAPKLADEEGLARSEAMSECLSTEAMASLSAIPASNILTHLDLGPRLIVMTPHNAIAGPYHRNGDDMLSIFYAFRTDAARARDIANQYDIDYVLLCRGIDEPPLDAEYSGSTLHVRLVAGDTPEWLESAPLPEGSPFMLWRVR